jgi:hypothetical protein
MHEMDTKHRSIGELARRLAAAYVSHTMGVSLDTTYQEMKLGEPGEFWYQLARRLSGEPAETRGNARSRDPRD